MSADLVMCLLSVILGYALRVGSVALEIGPALIASAVAVTAWSVASWACATHRGVTLYLSQASILVHVRAAFYMCAISTCAFVIGQFPGVPRTLGIIQPTILLILVLGIRSAVSSARRPLRSTQRNVLICGADDAARHLASTLLHDGRFCLTAFVDPDGRHVGRLIDGVPVFGMEAIETIVVDKQIDELFVTHQVGHRATLREITHLISEKRLNVKVRHLPTTAQIAAEDVVVSSLKEVDVGDLLGRSPVPPRPELLARNVEGKTVLVTGAGGSIGSELCRQIVQLSPARLILAERAEYNLYSILDELEEIAARENLIVDIEPALVDVADEGPCSALFDRVRPDTVIHAAAYKHVPLVEANVVAGVENNILGTLYSALNAERVGCSTFILVSTDKAVRPTNVMGASKRVCELIIQARAAQSKTCFSAVRFGNVLGSSGSVIPKFRRQIAAGGPVTVTHRDVTRYFMTIPEAALLVIQAGAMAEGGDLFLLDMGEPVRISALAETMIELSGLTVRSAENPGGDIAVVEVGLRPGEKLFEELLIADRPLETEHPRIVRAREDSIAWPSLEGHLDRLASFLEARDEQAIRSWLAGLVSGFQHKRSSSTILNAQPDRVTILA